MLSHAKQYAETFGRRHGVQKHGKFLGGEKCRDELRIDEFVDSGYVAVMLDVEGSTSGVFPNVS